MLQTTYKACRKYFHVPGPTKANNYPKSILKYQFRKMFQYQAATSFRMIIANKVNQTPSATMRLKAVNFPKTATHSRYTIMTINIQIQFMTHSTKIAFTALRKNIVVQIETAACRHGLPTALLRAKRWLRIFHIHSHLLPLTVGKNVGLMWTDLTTATTTTESHQMYP